MVLDLLDGETLFRLFGLTIWTIMFMAVGYSMGFKDGKREGFLRGKTVGRHAANAVKK